MKIALLLMSILTVSAFCATAESLKTDDPLWIRYPSISYDGEKIAFSYQGQIWVVSSSGGDALPYTDSEFYSAYPVWSRDGKYLAFASKQFGNFDIFVMPANGGGKAKRITRHSTNDIPYTFSKGDKNIYFSSLRLGDKNSATYVAATQLYSAPVDGGREMLELATPAVETSISPDGRYILYSDVPTLFEEFRKHEISDATKNIWVYDSKEKKHTQLTFFRGTDRNPIWDYDGKSFYFLSDMSGSLNVWKKSFDGKTEAVQITFHKNHPVRFLSVSNNGIIVYGYDGEVWKIDSKSQQAQKVKIRITQSSMDDYRYRISSMKDTGNMSLSPNGIELATIVRGEVFVVSTITGKSRRITNTPQQESTVRFANNGRSLLYASERNGSWKIYESIIASPKDTLFLEAAKIEERLLISSDLDIFAPLPSNDGSKIAYMEDRKRIKVFDRKSGKTKTAFEDPETYLYFDNELPFSWSKDDAFLAVTSGSFLGNLEVLAVDISGKLPPVNISQSGYADIYPKFSGDGKSIIWLSDRAGLRSGGSDTAQNNLFRAFLDKDSFESAKISPEEEIAASFANQKKLPIDNSTPTFLNEKSILQRTVQLMPFSMFANEFELMPDNTGAIIASVVPNMGITVYAIDFKQRRLSTLFNLQGDSKADLSISSDGKSIYLWTESGLWAYNMGQTEPRRIQFDAYIEWSPDEIAYIFEHTWKLTKSKFYDSNLHGVDWDFYKKEYRKFIPHIKTREDLIELLKEMSGELNASHTGAGDATSYEEWMDNTASFGVYYDWKHKGKGVMIDEILVGGPADKENGAVKKGSVILSVDGQEITDKTDMHGLLNNKVGKKVHLEVMLPNSKSIVSESLIPFSIVDEMRLANERWVNRNKEITEKLSGKKVGYLYIAQMNEESYGKFFSELFGQMRTKEAVIVDVRYNAGGNLSADLIALLGAKKLSTTQRRDGNILAENPSKKWTKPIAVLANASSYSDSMIFPYYFKTQKLGSLIGEKIPGSGTYVIWDTQIGGTMYYGVPQLGTKGVDGRWLEHSEITPDVLVYNNPNDLSAGRDLQLEKAIEVILDSLHTK